MALSAKKHASAALKSLIGVGLEHFGAQVAEEKIAETTVQKAPMTSLLGCLLSSISI